LCSNSLASSFALELSTIVQI
jgi:hypothetical protein